MFGGNYFCYLYIRDSYQAYTCMGLFAIGVVLLFFSIYQFLQNAQIARMRTLMKLTFMSIFASILCYLIKVILSEAVYWYYQLNGQQGTFEVDPTLVKYEFMVDCMLNFMLRTTIILVPAHMLQIIKTVQVNVLSIVSAPKPPPSVKSVSHPNEPALQIQLTPQQQEQLKESIQFESKSLKFIEVYFTIRAIISLVLMAVFVVVQRQDQQMVVALILLIQFQVKSLFVFAILVVGFVSVKRNKVLEEILDDDDGYEKLVKNYMLLIGIIVLRLASDIFFIVCEWRSIFSESACAIQNSKQSQEVNWIGIGVILSETLLTCYLSIFLILRIYRAEEGHELTDFQRKVIEESRISESFSSDQHGNDRVSLKQRLVLNPEEKKKAFNDVQTITITQSC